MVSICPFVTKHMGSIALVYALYSIVYQTQGLHDLVY